MSMRLKCQIAERVMVLLQCRGCETNFTCSGDHEAGTLVTMDDRHRQHGQVFRNFRAVSGFKNTIMDASNGS